MQENTIRGRTALVTGASSGLGADFARELASLGCHMVLVARREELLRSLQSELQAQHGVPVEVFPLDLSLPGAPERLREDIGRAGMQVDILINNAGFGLFGSFADLSWEDQHRLLELDVVALTHLTKVFLSDMLERHFGYILLLASNGAFQPTPTYAVYSAAKSYVLMFGEALKYELRGTGVSCTVVAPGITATEFLKVSGQRATLYQRLVVMQSRDVVRTSIAAMLRGRATVVPGWLNAVVAWSTRFMPRQWSAAIAYRMMTVGQ